MIISYGTHFFGITMCNSIAHSRFVYQSVDAGVWQVVELLWNLDSNILAVWCKLLSPDGSIDHVSKSYGNRQSNSTEFFVVWCVTCTGAESCSADTA